MQLHRSFVAQRVERGSVAGLHWQELDTRITERGACEEMLDSEQQLLIGAVVGGQAEHVCLIDGIEIGVNIGSTEPVDGLFRVAYGDEHFACECCLEDLPLHPIGVLEFVDEYHRESCRELLGYGGSVHRIEERIV